MARAGLTTERVVHAAADLADTVGFDQVTVSAVARGFGVKDASLYSHVKNLQDLRTKVAALAARELADRITAAVAGRTGKDVLVAFATAYRDFAIERPGRYAATQQRVDPELAADPAFQHTVEISYAMLRAYDLVEPDITDAVRLLRSTVHGYASLEARGQFRHSGDTQVSWNRAVDAMHVMLENWPSAPAATSTSPSSSPPS